MIISSCCHKNCLSTSIPFLTPSLFGMVRSSLCTPFSSYMVIVDVASMKKVSSFFFPFFLSHCSTLLFQLMQLMQKIMYKFS